MEIIRGMKTGETGILKEDHHMKIRAMEEIQTVMAAIQEIRDAQEIREIQTVTGIQEIQTVMVTREIQVVAIPEIRTATGIQEAMEIIKTPAIPEAVMAEEITKETKEKATAIRHVRIPVQQIQAEGRIDQAVTTGKNFVF